MGTRSNGERGDRKFYRGGHACAPVDILEHSMPILPNGGIPHHSTLLNPLLFDSIHRAYNTFPSSKSVEVRD